ncbi:MAG: nitroreductase family protein [Thaumarchaeota archaeon]|nr:nitroreductase family protein [Nitrososphaerota archaeon]
MLAVEHPLVIDADVQKSRKSQYEINPNIINRWSPRSFSGEVLSNQDLFKLFEAARWAPSSYNNQPWRFIYAKRESKQWDSLFDLLVDFNKQWCTNASVLVVIISKKTFEHNGMPSFTHQFDAGAAWENLALQATFQGLAAHAMQGFDYEKARRDLEIPDDYEVTVMVAIGKRASPEKLPQDLRQREVPSNRKPISEIVMEGKFGNHIGEP